MGSTPRYPPLSSIFTSFYTHYSITLTSFYTPLYPLLIYRFTPPPNYPLTLTTFCPPLIIFITLFHPLLLGRFITIIIYSYIVLPQNYPPNHAAFYPHNISFFNPLSFIYHSSLLSLLHLLLLLRRINPPPTNYPQNCPLIVHHFTAKNYPPLSPLLLLLRRITPPPPISPKGSFPFVPASLEGACYLRPPDTRAIFLHNNLLCNGTCSVSGGRITYLGAQTEKILPQNF